MSDALSIEDSLVSQHDDAPQLHFELTPTQAAFVNCPNRYPVLIGPEGEGKCLKYNTYIMMHDGRTKPVQDIAIGESVMGPDSRPRRVLSLARGQEEMVEIVPVSGEPWGCNLSHILALQRGPDGYKANGKAKSPGKLRETVLLTAECYIEQSKTFRKHHYLYRVPLTFPTKPVPVDAYWLGAWLGDGTQIQPTITTPEHEIVEYLGRLAAQEGLRLATAQDGTCTRATIRSLDGQHNPYLTFLQQSNLIHGKHIPHDYKTNSIEVRRAVLAGLLDTDGWVNKSGYQAIFKPRQLADDMAYIARSLGLSAVVKPRTKSCKAWNVTGTYWQVMLSGDFRDLPMLVKRKRPIERKQIKDVLRTGIKEVRHMGVGDYYGFTLEGDGLFLLADFTVTHNTFAAIAGIFAHYQRCGSTLTDGQGRQRPMMAAFIRDTHENLKRHTKRSIERACGDAVEFHNDSKIMIAPGIICDLYGMDDEKAAGRIQGGEYDLISLEEPAPILHSGNAGIREIVFDVCTRRIRGGETPKRLQVTMNPASTDHWTYGKFIKFPDPEVRVFRIRKGENPHLSKEDRTARARTFAHRPDLAKRYDEGEFGDVFPGVAVTPEFSEQLHVPYDQKNGTARWLLPFPGLETIRCWDGGLNPSCVILQITPSGHLNFVDSIVGENMGMRQMIRTKLKKILSRPRYERITKWRDIGDPALDTRDQSDSDQRASYVIEEELHTTFEKGVTSWDVRREGLKEMFSRIVDGRAMTLINPRVTDGEECNWLISGFSGGYQYPVNATGQVSRDGPLKNKFSHPCDAVSHAIPILLFPAKEPERRAPPSTKIIQRVKGYGVR